MGFCKELSQIKTKNYLNKLFVKEIFGGKMNLSEYENYMKYAIKEADKAFKIGEFPVGCVIVQDGQIIATGARKGTSNNMKRPSEIDHAEIRALKNIEITDINIKLDQAVLFCTMEPCLMCFAAIILSGIKNIVYAYEDVMGGGTSCDLNLLPPLYKNSNINLVSGVLRNKSLEYFKMFFSKKKNLYWKNSLLEQYTLKQAELSI